MRYREVELTPEMEERLRGFAPITATPEFKYTPKVFRDLPKSAWPVFKLRSLTGPERLDIEDQHRTVIKMDNQGATSREIVFQPGAYAMAACRGHVLGWSRYCGADGKDIPFDRSLSQLPSALIHELANAILDPDAYRLSPEEEQGLAY
jgi:hypothetical protein